jgi:hypothetical protein
MSALQELVHQHPWWDLVEFILWVGTRDPEIIARRAHLSNERRWERGLDELRKRAAKKSPDEPSWWIPARRALLAGELEVTYFASEGPRKIETHEFPYLEFMPETSSNGPHLYWKNAGLLDRLDAARVKATSIVTAFPMETSAIAPLKVGPDGGRPSDMLVVEATLDHWIEGGPNQIRAEIQRWTPKDKSVGFGKAGLSRALAGWAAKAKGIHIKAESIEKATQGKNKIESLTQKFATALRLIKK